MPERDSGPTAAPVGAAELRALGEVYARLDDEVDELRAQCRACGECCTFPEGGPVLYATLLEREFLARVPPPRRSSTATGACPYMDPTTRMCEARERRTLGCRTHFCAGALASPAARQRAHDMNERGLGSVRELCRERGIMWDYAPVVAWLRERFDTEGADDGSVD